MRNGNGGGEMNNGLRDKLIREQIEFSAADTLCFIMPRPAELAQIQREQWTPVIDAVNAAGCDFKMSETLAVPPVAKRTRDFLEKRLSALTDAELSAFCQVSGGCKSVALAVAVLSGLLPAERAFDLSVLEETYQNRFWPTDAEGAAARENRKKAVVDAAKTLKGE